MVMENVRERKKPDHSVTGRIGRAKSEITYCERKIEEYTARIEKARAELAEIKRAAEGLE